jgi:hypothetical protein
MTLPNQFFFPDWSFAQLTVPAGFTSQGAINKNPELGVLNI